MRELTKVGAIMVLFQPDWTITRKAITSLSHQVDMLCIVDNTPENVAKNTFDSEKNISYIPLGQNRGIAAAQNIGIKYFLAKENVEFIIFSDQDSIAPPKLVNELKAHFLFLSKRENVLVVGPQPYSRISNLSYVKKWTRLNIATINNYEYWEMLLIISSLSLTKLSYFKTYGVFCEDLFIDGVEHEWNWRVREQMHGKIFMIPQLKISHELGKSEKVFGHYYNKSSPFRLYFQIRNYMWLRKLQYTPKIWSKKHIVPFILKSIYYPLLSKPHMAYFKAVYRGWKDGLFNSFTTEHCTKI